MINYQNCPCCGKKANSDIAHRKTCVNSKCDEHMYTYLHYEWIALHDEKKPKIAAPGVFTNLTESFA